MYTGASVSPERHNYVKLVISLYRFKALIKLSNNSINPNPPCMQISKMTLIYFFNLIIQLGNKDNLMEILVQNGLLVKTSFPLNLQELSTLLQNGTCYSSGTLDLSVLVLWVKLFGHLGKNKDLTDLK